MSDENENEPKARKPRVQGANLYKISFAKLAALTGEKGSVMVSKKWLQEVAMKKALADLEAEVEEDEDAEDGEESSAKSERGESPKISVAAKEFDFNDPDADQ